MKQERPYGSTVRAFLTMYQKLQSHVLPVPAAMENARRRLARYGDDEDV